mmetsp:Transcript_33103/g.73175  ORF Transcript_33103/g.73175 Transcript_33103/m.73175 type:complete len:215 (-) Transcript_33103:1041-1685(-)
MISRAARSLVGLRLGLMRVSCSCNQVTLAGTLKHLAPMSWCLQCCLWTAAPTPQSPPRTCWHSPPHHSLSRIQQERQSPPGPQRYSPCSWCWPGRWRTCRGVGQQLGSRMQSCRCMSRCSDTGCRTELLGFQPITAGAPARAAAAAPPHNHQQQQQEWHLGLTTATCTLPPPPQHQQHSRHRPEPQHTNRLLLVLQAAATSACIPRHHHHHHHR